ncbi:uncharacterized protein LOC109122297 [Vitis vinifera]|uniref:uncharacterized protein LOC109122297 n=1 Tax=Vitis vinifera TaxID=29760 RepID=UPI0008FFBC6E|nr:uncharacterized protein LOC109122297 [Vitis vinifera]|eukprot:XP_019074366.1 PREDICTED: uncharacterized protein LOC109122297 [Vitis vinifera]
MEKVERILWRVVPGMKRFLILSKTLSFSCLLFPTYISMISWLLRIRSPLSRLLFPSLLSWALVNYVLATFACHSFTNPAILSRIFGSSETRRKISDLGFERHIQILEGFGWTFYFDLCIPLLLMHESCLAWFAALVASCFSSRLQRSSSMKKQIKLIMTWWEDDDYKEEEYGEELRIEEEEEKAEDQLRIEEEEEEKEKAEDLKKWMEKEKHKGYRRKWEEEKEEKARLNGELCVATKWADYCQTFLQNYEEERRKWEEERSELTAKLSAAQKSSDLYQQLLHECSSF